MKGKTIGILLFVAVVVVAVLASVFTGQGALLGLPRQTITVTGYVGGEKIGFLADEQVQKILKDRYGIVVDYTKAGSIEMVSDYDLTNVDFVFPSSQTAYEIYKQAHGGQSGKSEKVFFSPIVLYSWDTVAEALTKNGLCEKNGGYYTADLGKLVEQVLSGAKWNDFGLDIYGGFKIISTDPNKSNSGTMYAALLANNLSGNDVASAADITRVSSDVKRVFALLGQMESSSGTLFTRYLNLGMGESPLIVGYENQIIEFAESDPELWAKVSDQVALIYPEPTVWSEHYLITLTENGEKLLTALMDEDIQQIAWEKHGFRTGSSTYSMSQESLDALGISQSISQVVPVPDAQSMLTLLQMIASN